MVTRNALQVVDAKSPFAKRPTLDTVTTYYRQMYYGNPGTAKTTAIAAAAKLGRVVYIDADNGLKAKALRRHGIPDDNIEPVFDVTYDKLVKLHEELQIRLANDEPIFALAWDTTTKTAELFLDEVMPRSLQKTLRKGVERSQFEVYLEDRGEVVQMMTKLMRLFYNLPCHLILGAHQRRDVDKETSVVEVGPALSPSVMQSFSGWVDGVIHCRSELFENDPSLAEWDGQEFMGLTRPEGRFVAKERFGLLPKRMINPHFDRVVAYLDGELVKEDDPLQQAAIRRRRDAIPAPAEATTDEPSQDQPEENES